jgi:hypothetical protein
VTLTADNWTARVMWEVGQALPGGPSPADPVTTQALAALQAQVDVLWEMAGAVSPPHVYVRFLYCKLSAIDTLLGELRLKTDAMLGSRGGLRVSGSQRFGNLFKLRKEVTAEITAWLVRLRARGTPLTAPILARAPVDPAGLVHVPAAGEPVNPAAVGPGNPNWEGYRGSPFWQDDPDPLTPAGGGY